MSIRSIRKSTIIPLSGMMVIFFLLLQSPLHAQWTLSGPDGAECPGIFDGKLYIQAGPGMYVTDDGLNWNLISEDLPPDGITGITSIGNVMAIGFTYYGVLLSEDSGLTWNPCEIDTMFAEPTIASMTEHKGYLFAGGNADYIYRSSDSGKHWDTVDNIPDTINSWDFGAYCFASYDSLLLAGFDGWIYRTINDGLNWEPVRVAPLSQGNTELFIAMTKIENVFIVGGRYGAYRSSDLGLTWQPLDSNWFSKGLYSVVSANGCLVGGTINKVLISRDTGTTWKEFNQGLPDSIGALVDGMIVYDSNIYLITSTNGQIYRRPLSDFAISSVTPQPATNNSLGTYPNPLTNSTTLDFTAAQRGYVTISIVNQLGVEIAHVFAGELEAGEHSYQWNVPAGTPEGAYQCIVRSEGSNVAVPLVIRH